ncbi:MAG: sulfotransferase family 2 domain-containing protein [Alteraurantiacibacter sp.]
MTSFAKKLRLYRQNRAFYREQRAGSGYAFIHINKCGGTSIERTLDLYKLHDTAQKRIKHIGRARWDAMYTFSVVRHPYSRVCSLYEFRVKTNQTGLGDRPVDLDEWVRLVFEERDPAYRNKPLMFAPCFEWLSDDDGTIMIDEWFRLEELDSHWPHIMRKTGARELARHNSTSSFNELRALERLSPQSVATIDHVFARDFETFGYNRAESITQPAGDVASAP